MRDSSRFVSAVILLSAALIGLLLARPHPSPAHRPGPQTMDEVIDRAEELGFYYRSDSVREEVHDTLVVSDRPITREQATNLRMDEPHSVDWIGRVSIRSHWRNLPLFQLDERFYAIWGEVLMFGDPEMIRRLVGE
jgi:hypothetical protein